MSADQCYKYFLFAESSIRLVNFRFYVQPRQRTRRECRCAMLTTNAFDLEAWDKQVRDNRELTKKHPQALRIVALLRERMKGGQVHRVPLGKRALEIASIESGTHLFPSRKFPDKAISETRLRDLLRQLGQGDITIHGFRSCFKTWAMERTRFDNHTIEAALAHSSGDKVEQAYMRSDVLEKRAQLMTAWEKFCETPPAKSADPSLGARS